MMIRSSIKRVGFSDYLLTIKEDRLTKAPVTVFEGYYGSERDAIEARDQCALGLNDGHLNSMAPICQESERYSVLIRRNGYWKFGPYWDEDIFSVNVKLDNPPMNISASDALNGQAWYTVEHYKRVWLRNIVLYPITIYAVDPEELVEEEMPMLLTLIDRLRPKRRY